MYDQEKDNEIITNYVSELLQAGNKPVRVYNMVCRMLHNDRMYTHGMYLAISETVFNFENNQ